MRSHCWRAAAAVVGLAAAVVPQKLVARDVIRPAFELRIERRDLFTKSEFAPLFEAMVDEFSNAMGLEDQAKRGVLERHWESLAWPLTVQVYPAKDGVPMLALWSPKMGPALLPTLIAVHDGDLREQGSYHHEGENYTTAVFVTPEELAWELSEELMFVEGTLRGQRLTLVSAKEVLADPSDTLKALAPEPSRPGVSRKQLMDFASGGEVGWWFHFRTALRMRGWGMYLEPFVGLLFGPRLSGISGRITMAGDRVSLDYFADLRPGAGFLGSLLQREPQELELLGWVPEEATEFVAIDLSIDGIVRLMHQAGIFGGLEASDLVSELAWMQDIDLEAFLDTHFSGQVVVVREAGIDVPTEIVDVGDIEGVVVAVGSWDGRKLLDFLVERVNADAEPGAEVLREAPEQGPGIYAVHWNGGKRMYLSAAKDALFLATAEPAGAELMRKVLSTVGKSERPGGEDLSIEVRTATMLGRGEILDEMVEFVDASVLGHTLTSRLQEIFDEVYAGNRVVSWRVVADRTGTRLHVDL